MKWWKFLLRMIINYKIVRGCDYDRGCWYALRWAWVYSKLGAPKLKGENDPVQESKLFDPFGPDADRKETDGHEGR